MKPLLEIAIEKIPESFDPDEILPARAGHLVNLERRGFIAGAQWRINSVWHDASERPEVNKRVLVEFFNKYGNYVYYRLKAFKPAQLKHWGIEMAFLDKIIRWTYIEDLLPADSE